MHVTFRAGPPRLPVVYSVLCTLLTQMLWWASPAQSQSLLQQIFGLSPSPQVNAAPRYAMPRQPVGNSPMRSEPGVWHASSTPRDSAKANVAAEGSGSYTTVCVRTCDGFYFPLSHRVPRSRFQRDADMCRARCGQSEARLFFHSSGQDMKSAVDVTGRTYVRMPTAFLHRKKLVDGCGCRPEPWSQAASIRHEGFAIAEGRSLPAGGRSGGSLTVVAGNYPDSPVRANVDKPSSLGSTEEAAGSEQQPASAVIGQSDEPAIAVVPIREPKSLAQTKRAAPFVAAAATRRQVSGSVSGSVGGQAQLAARAAASKAPGVKPAAGPRKPTSLASAGTGSRMVWPGDPVRLR